MGKRRGRPVERGITKMKDGRLLVRVRVTKKGMLPLEEEDTLDRGTTLREARARREEIRARLREEMEKANAHVGLPSTIDGYAELLLKQKAATLEMDTVDWYRHVLAHHILPIIGDVKIADISRTTTRLWVSECDKSPGYSKHTRLGWWGVVKELLLDIKAEYGLLHDPTERVRPPKRDDGRVREHRGLGAKDFVRFMQKARERFPQRYAEIVLLASTGMRVSEMYGLMWDAVSFENAIITIRHRATKGRLKPSTKTGLVRTVPLVPTLATKLLEHRKGMIRAQHPGLSTNLVFPSDNGKARYASSIRKPMNKLAEELGISVRVGPQVLRRTVDTMMLEAGVPATVVRQQLGHLTEEMTHHYASHDVAAKLDGLNRAMGELLEW